jgi:hypothetical protein
MAWRGVAWHDMVGVLAFRNLDDDDGYLGTIIACTRPSVIERANGVGIKCKMLKVRNKTSQISPDFLLASLVLLRNTARSTETRSSYYKERLGPERNLKYSSIQGNYAVYLHLSRPSMIAPAF